MWAVCALCAHFLILTTYVHLQASSLPGLDAGDIAKTFSALRLFHRLILHVPVLQQKVSEKIFQEALSDDLLPVVDANINIGAHLRAKQLRKASKSVSEKYAQYCECVDALHAWVPELLKRIIQVLEIQEAVSSDDDSPAGLNGRQGSGSQARLVHQLRFLLRPLFGQLDPVLRRKFAGASLVHQITSRGFGTLMNAARAGLIGVVLQVCACMVRSADPACLIISVCFSCMIKYPGSSETRTTARARAAAQ